MYGALLRSAPSKYDRGRLRAVKGDYTGSFWNATPSTYYNLALPPPHFRVLVRWWLGEAVYSKQHACPFCGKPSDPHGYHSLTCRFGGDLGVRHNAIRNTVAHAAKLAALNPRIEVRAIPGSNDRPADLLIPGDRDAVCDFAVTHCLQPAYIDGTADGSRSAAEAYARTHKVNRYASRVEEAGGTFYACVLDVYGNWCAAGSEILNLVATALSLRDGRRPHVHLRMLIQRCAVSLVLSNARALLQREDPSLVGDDSLPIDGAFDPQDDTIPTASHSSTQNSGADDGRVLEPPAL